jgi:hypothetical protein
MCCGSDIAEFGSLIGVGGAAVPIDRLPERLAKLYPRLGPDSSAKNVATLKKEPLAPSERSQYFSMEAAGLLAGSSAAAVRGGERDGGSTVGALPQSTRPHRL